MSTPGVKAHDPAEEIRQWRRVLTATAVVLALCAAFLVLAGQARAATVSGTLKGGKGYQVVLVQGNGVASKVAVTKSSGAFSLTAKKLAHATLHLVKADGTYLGPFVLKAALTKDYCTIAGKANLRLGTVYLKNGYALAARAPLGRYDTHPTCTVTAKRGRPIGAGKAGLVATGKPAGYRGDGGDLDRDGVVGAFDIDDNGNRILDNTDDTMRGESRPPVPVAPRTAAAQPVGRGDTPPPPPPPQFRISSNFRMGGGDQFARVNANIPGITDMDALVNRYLPEQLLFFMTVMGADPQGNGTATLDGLGNAWVPQHEIGGELYPKIEITWPDLVPATHSKGPGLIDLVAGTDRRGDAFIYTGALADQVSPGDAFVEIAADGTQYPGVLNFAFTTVPALKSYQFSGQDAVDVEYAQDGMVTSPDQGVIPVPNGATQVKLTFWRPQRKAAPGEVGSLNGNWVDMGKLGWEAPPMETIQTPGGMVQVPVSWNGIVGAAADSGSESKPITLTEPDGAAFVVDPTADAAANGANTISLTIDLSRMFPDWGTFEPGTIAEIDVGARTLSGDLASSRVQFELQ